MFIFFILGCFLLGQWFEQEKLDLKRSADAYRKGCDELNYSKCCDRLASFYYFGKSEEKNINKAKDYWLKGCYDTVGLTPRDPMLSCYHGGQLLTGSISEEKHELIKPDPVKGIQMLEKACQLKLSEACQSLHELFLFGNDHVPKDAKKAFDYGLIGCDYLNYTCCHNTFKMLQKGEGVTKDLEKANELKKKMKEIEFQITNEMKFSQYT